MTKKQRGHWNLSESDSHIQATRPMGVSGVPVVMQSNGRWQHFLETASVTATILDGRTDRQELLVDRR